MAKTRELQRQADAKAAKERVELERRQKIQDDAVAKGKTARTVIPEPETVQTSLVSAPDIIKEDSKSHYRMAYKVSAVDELTDDYCTRVPDAKAIQTTMLALEKTYAYVEKQVTG